MIPGVTASISELIALKSLVSPSKLKSLTQTSAQMGLQSSKHLGRGMDFSEIRHYQAGDDIRHMEWRVTARTGRPHIKVYSEERERPVLLWVHFSPSMYFGTRVAFKSLIAARYAALIAWTVVQQGDRIGALLFSNQQHHDITPKSHQHAILPLLSHLSAYTQYDPSLASEQTSKDSTPSFLKLRRIAKPGTTIVLLSDFYDINETHLACLRQLTQHNQVISYQINDPLETHVPVTTQALLTDGLSFLNINTTLPSVRIAYEKMCHHQALIADELKKIGVFSHRLSTDADLVPILVKTFIRRCYG